uniref:BPTI/Kunitz inhibitor domain-containing protein n=1 Tax=Salmo trutta TaxID=8032 RepID=A0A674AK06_SALTR
MAYFTHILFLLKKLCIHQTHNYPSYFLSALSGAVCDLRLDHGSCFAMLLMYYYNAKEGTCRIFHYGGCQGNGNRFETRECPRDVLPSTQFSNSFFVLDFIYIC